MSARSFFCENVRAELLSDIPRKPCCRQSFYLGLLFAAKTEGNLLTAEYASPLTANALLSLLPGQENGMDDTVINHHRVFVVSFRQKRMPELLDSMNADTPFDSLVKKPCVDCKRYFLAGAFLACGHVTSPKKGNHLEMKMKEIPNGRIEFFLSICESLDVHFRRDKNGRIYLKSNQTIGDFLSLIGALSAGFQIADAYIEKDFRNTENRATNCVARNIAESVRASERDISAIRLILAESGEESIPRDLRKTAELRLTNAELSLSEIGRLHSPTLTKSGVRHRLDKIVAIADEISERKKLANN